MVGYQRFDTTAELETLRALYPQLRLYKNFFQPTMKLKSKARVGGRIRRQYDEPRTPYQRLLQSGQLTRRAKKELQALYESLRVTELRKSIEQLRDRLFNLVEAKAPCSVKPRPGKLMLSIGPAERRRQWLMRAAGQ